MTARLWSDIELPPPFETFKTGIAALDALHYLRIDRPDLIVLGAATGVGKTSLAMQIALEVGKVHPVQFFSLEMSKEALREKYRYSRLLKYSSRLYIDDVKRADLPTIYNLIQDQCLIERPKLILIDYIQIIKVVGRPSKKDQIEHIMASLSDMAAEFSIPILMTAQLNREFMKREPKEGEEYVEPKLSDLADGANIEHWGDVVLVLTRKHKEEPYVKVFCMKNRHGKPEDFELVQDLTSLAFTGQAIVKYDY